MRRIIRFFWVLTLVLSPTVCFSWGESKHSISELLIQRVYLDTNYVFCGCDAYWGTNVFGLFVFDRRTETWTNYPHLRRVKNIEREGDFVYVTSSKGPPLAFNRLDGSFEEAAREKVHFMREFTLTVDGVPYRVFRDSIIVGNTPNAAGHTPSSELIPEPTGIKPIPNVLNPIFSHPVGHQNKIYMPYDLGLAVTSTYTDGIAAFDIVENTFQFYGSEIFKGTVTGSFVYDSLVIFPTARFIYEANARPAAGFVAFNLTDSTFSLWKELPLPDEPLAIFQVAQDEREYWIGTDKGVFRIDKKTNEATHYQIAKGIVAEDSSEVCASQGGYVVAKLDKGREVELLAVWNAWCEIKPPRHITGWIEGKYVEGVTLADDGHEHISKFKPLDKGGRIPVRVSDDPDAGSLLTLDAHSLEEYEYKVVAKVVKTDQTPWYKIKLPTAWISMDDLVFQLGEVDY